MTPLLHCDHSQKYLWCSWLTSRKFGVWWPIQKGHIGTNSYATCKKPHTGELWVANGRGRGRQLILQVWCMYLLIWIKASHFNTVGHIMTGSFMGRNNHYIQLVKVLCCKLPNIGKQLLPLLHRVWSLDQRPQRWEASVLPLRHYAPSRCDANAKEKLLNRASKKRCHEAPLWQAKFRVLLPLSILLWSITMCQWQLVTKLSIQVCGFMFLSTGKVISKINLGALCSFQ